jgi:hypothetical protein
MAEEKSKEVCPDCKDEGKRRVLNTGTEEYHSVRCHCQYTDLPIPLVLQAEKSGCGIAAIATVVGKTYKEVRQFIHIDRDFTSDGMYDSEMEDLLEVFGYSWQARGKNQPRLSTKREVWPPLPFAPLHIAQVKNLPDKRWHYVVMLEDGRVLDPWWGVVQGLHRYPEVCVVHGLWKIPEKV